MKFPVQAMRQVTKANGAPARAPQVHGWSRWIGWRIAWLGLLLSQTTPMTARATEHPNDRLRVIIETDAGGDPDDEQSLVRFLLYANEWDVEGIIVNRAEAREFENKNPERTGLGIVQRMIRAYGECHPRLAAHDPRYPSPEDLLRRTVVGYGDGREAIDLLMSAVDAPDPRPVWFCNWGTDNGSAPSALKLALDQVLALRGEKGYAAFKNRLRLSSDDQFGEHTTRDPPFVLWVDTFRPELDGLRWYHRFSALTATAGGFDVQRDVLTGHGPLGAMYPTNTTHDQKEGDTMTFLYLVPTGMNDPEQPTWGSWAGRYGPNPEFLDRNYYWANQPDSWQVSTHRDNSLLRWAADLQNDFRARLAWCVTPPEGANHAPVAVINGDNTTEILDLNVEPEQNLALSAAGSSDPDGQKISYRWFSYSEAGTYRGDVSIAGAETQAATAQFPVDAVGHSVHVVLVVRDHGSPPLARYRRVVVTCGPRSP